MRWIMLCFALLFTAALPAEEIFLRDNLMRAQPGDFIVTAQGRTYTLLLIRDKSAKTLTIEEVTVPSERFPKEAPSWRHWVEQGAPGHTAWVAYEIAPRSGQMMEFFSYTQNGWSDVPSAENFLGTLLNLKLQRADPKLRRRVGPMPRDGESDRRPFWSPPLVVDGKTIEGVAFDAWRTRWPKDDSDLSNKIIDVYLPRQGDKYPSYFPYWLQIGGAIGKAKVRIVDSGSTLKSPRPTLPRRPPTFLNAGRFEEGSLRLWLKTRPYYTDYQLFAIDNAAPDRPIPLQFSVLPTEDDEVVVLQVPMSTLQNKLPSGSRFRLRIKPVSHPQISAETSDWIRLES